MTVHGDKARALRLCVTGQINPCLGLAITDPGCITEQPASLCKAKNS
jgi:hypothetical protein